MSLCKECTAGPRGNDGHERLELMTRRQAGDAAAHFILECRDCGARWIRQFSREGPTWTMAA